MSPDDPRHGTTNGYRLGCRASCCRRAVAAQRAEQRKRYYLLRTDTLMVPTLGTRRRIEALASLGWTTSEVSRRAGYERSHLGLVVRRGALRQATAERIAVVYDQLSMQRPPEITRAEKIDASRARRIAAERGWPPPLAWDDIDDPTETPRGWQYAGPDRRAVLHELDDQGVGITAACRRLDLTRKALERWCQRNNERDLFRRLSERETPHRWANQYAEGGAA
jgi:hypothetical protein